jgi:hypothetical protein
MRVVVLAGLAGVAACPKPAADEPTAADTGPTIAKVEALGKLMKEQVNPAFSRLAFLLFHGGTIDAEPAAMRADLVAAAQALSGAIGQLRVWTHVPAQTEQGKEVFFTYATAVGAMTDELAVAITTGDDVGAKAKLTRIADTCDRCHHFFRLEVEDSVIPNAKGQTKPAVTAAITHGELR